MFIVCMRDEGSTSEAREAPEKEEESFHRQ